MNTRLGKPKPVTIRALLDSGGSETIVTKDLAKNLRTRTTSTNSTVWTTPGGKMVTNQKVKAQFTIPELHSDRLIEWNMHVTDNLGAYDMIIGRDIMTHLGIDVRFSTMEIEWDHRTMPFHLRSCALDPCWELSGTGCLLCWFRARSVRQRISRLQRPF